MAGSLTTQGTGEILGLKLCQNVLLPTYDSAGGSTGGRFLRRTKLLLFLLLLPKKQEGCFLACPYFTR